MSMREGEPAPPANGTLLASPVATCFQDLSRNLEGQLQLLRHILELNPDGIPPGYLQASKVLDQAAANFGLAAKGCGQQWLETSVLKNLAVKDPADNGGNGQGHATDNNAGVIVEAATGHDPGVIVVDLDKSENSARLAPVWEHSQVAAADQDDETGDDQALASQSTSPAAKGKPKRKKTKNNDIIDIIGLPDQDPLSEFRHKCSNLRSERDIRSGKQCLRALVVSPQFELFFAGVTIANAAVMALDAQYRGSIINIGTGNAVEPDRVAAWGSGHAQVVDIFYALEVFFGVLFTVEVVLRMLGLRRKWFQSGWNVFDAILVVIWYITDAMEVPFINTQVGRLLRLVKLFRLLKLVKQIKGMDALILMTTALEGSLRVLGWAVILLMIMQVLCALLVNQVLQDYFIDSHKSFYERVEMWKYFGTFTRSLLSMFELTLANWPPVCRLLQESHSEVWALLCVVHKFTFGFAVIGVINGVFMQETFKVASFDDRIMVRQKAAAQKLHEHKMILFFNAADVSKDGFLSQDEFRALAEKWEVRTWLSAMDLDVRDADRLFALIDDGDGKVSITELIKSVSQLRGAARSIDMVHLLRQVERIEDSLGISKTTNLSKSCSFDMSRSAVQGAKPDWSPSAMWSTGVGQYESAGHLSGSGISDAVAFTI